MRGCATQKRSPLSTAFHGLFYFIGPKGVKYRLAFVPTTYIYCSQGPTLCIPEKRGGQFGSSSSHCIVNVTDFWQILSDLVSSDRPNEGSFMSPHLPHIFWWLTSRDTNHCPKMETISSRLWHLKNLLLRRWLQYKTKNHAVSIWKRQ